MPEGATGLEDPIVDSVANSNLKTFHDLAMTEALGHMAALNRVRETVLTKSLEQIQNASPAEAAAATMILKSDVAKVMSELSSQIAAIGQMMKGMQSTPRETAVP